MDNNSVRYGLIAGLGAVIYSLLIYFLGQMGNMSLGLLGTGIYIFCMWKACQEDKAAKGGFASFREMFSSSFITYAVAALFAVAFQYVLVTMIDPGIAVEQAEMAVEKTAEILEWAGMEEGSKEYEEALADAEKNAAPSIKNSLIGFLGAIFMGAIISLIMAAAMKKERPAHLQVREDENDELA